MDYFSKEYRLFLAEHRVLMLGNLLIIQGRTLIQQVIAKELLKNLFPR